MDVEGQDFKAKHELNVVQELDGPITGDKAKLTVYNKCYCCFD